MANKKNPTGGSDTSGVGNGQHSQRTQGNSTGMTRPPQMKRDKGGNAGYKSNQQEGNHGGNR